MRINCFSCGKIEFPEITVKPGILHSIEWNVIFGSREDVRARKELQERIGDVFVDCITWKKAGNSRFDQEDWEFVKGLDGGEHAKKLNDLSPSFRLATFVDRCSRRGDRLVIVASTIGFGEKGLALLRDAIVPKLNEGESSILMLNYKTNSSD